MSGGARKRLHGRVHWHTPGRGKLDINDCCLEDDPPQLSKMRLQRELAAGISEAYVPRSSDTEADSIITDSLARAFSRAGWTPPDGWPR